MERHGAAAISPSGDHADTCRASRWWYSGRRARDRGGGGAGGGAEGGGHGLSVWGVATGWLGDVRNRQDCRREQTGYNNVLGGEAYACGVNRYVYIHLYVYM